MRMIKETAEDRRIFRECCHLDSARKCRAMNSWPVIDLLRRCEHYKPTKTTQDQRTGAERGWTKEKLDGR